MRDPNGPNAGQDANWNGPNGGVWVEMREALDHELADLGAAAQAALSPRPGERILDVGCGCGTTTLDLAHAVGPAGEAVGIDLSEPMLDEARRRAAEARVANVRFLEADAQLFAPEPASFDGLYSRFGVMLFAEPIAAFANLRRALRPGGRVGFVVWRTPAENPTMTLAGAAAAHILPPAPPMDPLAPGPFAFADPERVRAILTGAGFADVAVQPVDVEASPGDAETAVALYTQVGPVGRTLRENPALIEPVRAAVREALKPFDKGGKVTLGAAGWVVTARNP